MERVWVEGNLAVEYQEIFSSNWLLLVCGTAFQRKSSNESLACQFWSGPKLNWTQENTLQATKWTCFGWEEDYGCDPAS